MFIKINGRCALSTFYIHSHTHIKAVGGTNRLLSNSIIAHPRCLCVKQTLHMFTYILQV